MPEYRGHLQGRDGAQLRNFGYTTFATEAALNAQTTGNVNGEVAYVTATGCLYQWNPLENSGAGRWVKWADTNKSAWKEPARVIETTANITLASPGTTIDGVTMAAGDRVVLAAQTDPIENGVYIFDTDTTALVRAEDGDDAGELDGASILIEEGTEANSQYQQTADDVTPGADAQTWTKIGPATGVAPASDTAQGVVELSTDAEAITGTDTSRAVTPANLAAVLADGRGSALFGDGAASTFTIAHGVTGMAGEDLMLQVRDEATGEVMWPSVLHNDDTDITVTTLGVPTNNQYRVTWQFAG